MSKRDYLFFYPKRLGCLKFTPVTHLAKSYVRSTNSVLFILKKLLSVFLFLHFFLGSTVLGYNETSCTGPYLKWIDPCCVWTNCSPCGSPYGEDLCYDCDGDGFIKCYPD